MLAVAPVLARDALFGNKSGGVIAPGLQRFITDKNLLHALSGRILDLNVGVETKTAFDVTPHLLIRIARKRPFQIFLQHRDNFLAHQLDR